MRANDANLIAKAQVVRLADVFLIGPLMIYGAVSMAPRTALQHIGRFLLAGAGAATIVFNGRNYLYVERLRRRS